MSADMFLKIDGIEGESADGKHEKEIDILSWSLGASNAGTMAHGGGGGAGKVSFQDLSITKRIDKSSPKLLEHCASGKHIKKAVLIARKQGETQMEFLKVTMTDLLISSWQQGGADEASEQISINFSHIEYSYTAQNEKGQKAGDVGMKWNIKKNDNSGA